MEYHTGLPDVLRLVIFSQINCVCGGLAPRSKRENIFWSFMMDVFGWTFGFEWKVRLVACLTIATLMVTVQFIISCHSHNPVFFSWHSMHNGSKNCLGGFSILHIGIRAGLNVHAEGWGIRGINTQMSRTRCGGQIYFLCHYGSHTHCFLYSRKEMTIVFPGLLD